MLQISLRDAGGVEEVPAIDEVGEGRACGYARRTAVDLVADLLENVLRETDRKAGDVAAGGVAGLAPARRVTYLTSVARPNEMVHDLRSVTIGHAYPPLARVQRGDLSQLRHRGRERPEEAVDLFFGVLFADRDPDDRERLPLGQSHCEQNR